MLATYKTKDVFGISRELPMNYVDRKNVDNLFLESLTKEKHIVVFGSSKQGKTSLRKNCLKDDEYIVIHCSNRWNVEDIHTNILKRAGYEITQSTKKTSSGKNKIIASIKGFLPMFSSEVRGETEKTEQVESITSSLEIDPSDVNDVINALESISFRKYILLEDFHYLDIDAQRDFSIDLKAFHENSSLCFVIIGVWLDENRLIIHNGDLTGRVISINADMWNEEELRRVIEKGEKLLKVEFNSTFKEELIKNSFDSVYIIQEACYRACLECNIEQTQEEVVSIDPLTSVHQLVNEIVDQQSGRYNSFIVQFADGFQTTTLEMYRWILYPIITAKISDLEKGLRYSELRKQIQSHHPRGEELNPGNLTQALKSTASLQISKNIKPFILDYDETNLRLNIVDKGFLVWLTFKKTEELLELAGIE